MIDLVYGINLTEHLWDDLGRRVHGLQPQNPQQLGGDVRIVAEFLERPIRVSVIMTRHLCAVIDAYGEHTRNL